MSADILAALIPAIVGFAVIAMTSLWALPTPK
jgi:hypothetical protein